MYVEKMAKKHIQTRVADTKHFDSDPGPFTFGFRSESEFVSPKLKSFGTQKIKFLPKFSTGTGTNLSLRLHVIYTLLFSNHIDPCFSE